MQKTRLTAVIGLLVLLAGCGFHLRGSNSDQPYNPHLKTLYLTGPEAHGALMSSVRQNMVGGGTVLVNNASEAPYTLWIGAVQERIRTATVDNSARAAERTMILRAAFELRNPAGQVIFGPEFAANERIYQTDVEAVNAADNERQILRSDLLTQMANQITRRIRRLDIAALEAAASAANKQ